MKKPLILVKHSVPAIVESLPARAWPLSDEGRTRARHLAARLCRFEPQVLVSSGEPKARQTAEIAARALRLEPQVAEDLHEHDRSRVPYLTRQAFEASVDELFRRPDQLVFGDETADQAHARFEQAVQSVLNRHQDRTVAIVAHGTVISLFVARRMGLSPLLLWRELGLPSIVVLDLESNTLLARESIP